MWDMNGNWIDLARMLGRVAIYYADIYLEGSHECSCLAASDIEACSAVVSEIHSVGSCIAARQQQPILTRGFNPE